MRTNLEKWNFYLLKIKAIEQEFIDNNTDEVPQEIYEACRSGVINKLDVIKVYYNSRLHFFGAKPTREDVLKIKTHFDDSPELTIDKILIHYENNSGSMKTSSAIKYTQLGNRYFLNNSDAIKKSTEILKIKETEAKMLSNGHIKCSYCSKITPEREAVSCTIIFQNSRQDPFSRSGYKKFVDRKTNKYCSNKCGSYDQMAHEG